MNRESPRRTGNDRRVTGNNHPGIATATPRECRHINRRSAGTPPAFSGAPPGYYRRRPGLNRGVACRRSYGIPGFCRDAAVALPGRCRLSPGLNRGITGDKRGLTGINRSQSGVDRDSAGLLTGFNRGGTGK
ncbi:hypothetical protein DPMN_156476 [Dreissena polymorpha]|uniref:Uncharacterized protein n=1 Tax=Dreissena polymorpha TaxID=45954 RepID=A0A9D4JCE6_DREPO|nr:hypothetical protein DPMN_156476 [Dreissena polymorpha]